MASDKTTPDTRSIEIHVDFGGEHLWHAVAYVGGETVQRGSGIDRANLLTDAIDHVAAAGVEMVPESTVADLRAEVEKRNMEIARLRRIRDATDGETADALEERDEARTERDRLRKALDDLTSAVQGMVVSSLGGALRHSDLAPLVAAHSDAVDVARAVALDGQGETR